MLFNILSSAKFVREIGFELVDAEVLDLCCGSGAVSFEALSRGVKFVTLIDNSRIHLELAKKNAALLGVENQVEILWSDAKKLPANKKSFDLIFIDPPYAEDYISIVKSLIEKGWITKKSLIVIEAKARGETVFEGLKLLEKRKTGSTSFSFYASEL